MPGKHGSLEERLWRNIVKLSDGCWVWLGNCNHRGYGQIGEGGRGRRMLSTHRVSWMVSFGAIPDGLFVLHKCDNPPCVNPGHLFLGTQLDNMRDRSAKGRAPTGDRNIMRKWRPESRERAEKIRELFKTGTYTQRQLADEFNVCPSYVSQILAGKRWGGVPRRLTT
jgi:hypothetical protein